MANQISVNSRKFFREPRNGSTFATDTGVFSTYFKANILERVKFQTTITVKTIVEATTTTEILFEQGTSEVFFTHPYANWSDEGFKIGDTIRILVGASVANETITNIVGNVLTTTDATPVAATLGIVDGTYYDNLVFRNTTLPTSLVFKFGIIPNVPPPPAPGVTPSNPFKTWLDSQTQQYYTNGVTGTASGLTSNMVFPSSEITESVTIEHLSTASDYIFEFELIHIFRVEFYIADWLNNFINNAIPAPFSDPNYRYVCQYKFGTSATDPNEKRIFNDFVLNGAVGFVDNNFTNGLGVYGIISVDYENSLGASLNQLEVTETNTVTMQIEKTSANFSAGEKVILYVSRMPPPAEMAEQPDPWYYKHVFAQATAEDGGPLVDSDFIKDLMVEVNSGDNSLLDIIFDIEYDTTQKSLISNGDRYFIGVSCEDITLSAVASDGKVVWCDCNTYTKNTDIPDLITGNSAEIYSSEKTPNGASSTTNAASWNNRLHHARFNFLLTKNNINPHLPGYIKIVGLKGQIVSRNSTTGESFVCDEYAIPMSFITTIVGGAAYQIVNQTNYRNFNIKSTAEANKSTIISEIPGSFQTTQEWVVRWPFVFNWRQWQANPNCPTSFYDALEEMNNMNYRTSNYDGGGWDIYIRLVVIVNTQGVNTDYGLYSTKCSVRDFDVDPPTSNWTAATQLFDEDGIECDYIKIGHDMRIKTTFSMPTAGGLDYANLFAEHTIEEYQSLGDNFRLHSVVDWSYTGNMLKPLVGETKTKVTQDVPGNQIIVESLIDKDTVDSTKSYNVYSHLQENR